jgi:hypothetical protein
MEEKNTTQAEGPELLIAYIFWRAGAFSVRSYGPMGICRRKDLFLAGQGLLPLNRPVTQTSLIVSAKFSPIRVLSETSVICVIQVVFNFSGTGDFRNVSGTSKGFGQRYLM